MKCPYLVGETIEGKNITHSWSKGKVVEWIRLTIIGFLPDGRMRVNFEDASMRLESPFIVSYKHEWFRKVEP